MQLPDIFNNTNLWIRLVDKRGRMRALLDASDNGDSNALQALRDTFTEELAGYGGFYFNTLNTETPEYWNLRNELSPVLNSILFVPSIALTVSNNEKEGDNITFQNSIDLILNDVIPANLNINKTQIENIQNVLNNINQAIPKYPIGHQDLKNIIRIDSFEVKWITDSFLTQEATLNIYFEHFQLLKTQLAKELMRPNKRIKVQTKFYDVLGALGDSYEIKISFLKSLGYDFSDPKNNIISKYQKFIDASNDNKDTDWVIYNFDTEFDDQDGVMLSIKLVKHAVPVLQQKSFQTIKPINLLTKEVIQFFNDNDIIKISDGKNFGNQVGGGLAFVPKIALDNRDNSKSKNSNLNLTKTTYMVIDASRFIIYLLWLYAIKYKEYYDSTEGYVNKQEMSNQFVVTFEMDMSDPQSQNNLRERYNGCLMSYINTSTNNQKKDYKSIGLFDFNKTKSLFENKYTDVCFDFLSASSSKVFQWNLNGTEIYNKELQIKGFNNDINSYLWSSLIRQAYQENFIESVSASLNKPNEDNVEIKTPEVPIPKALTKEDIKYVSSEADATDQRANEEFDSYYTNALNAVANLVNGTADDKEYLLARKVMRESIRFRNIESQLRTAKIVAENNKRYSNYIEISHNGNIGMAIVIANLFGTNLVRYKVGKDEFSFVGKDLEGWVKQQNYMGYNNYNSSESESNINVEQEPPVPKRHINVYYNYPLLKMSVSDDKWLSYLDTSVDNFIRTQLIDLFDNTKNSEAHFKTPGAMSFISLSNDKIESSNGLTDLNKLVWQASKKNIGTIYQDSDSDYTYNEDGKHESLIFQQISDFESLKFSVIPRTKESKLDGLTRKFIDKNILNDKVVWLEIKISDTKSFILNDHEQKIYAKIQNDVIKGLDTKNVVMMNQIHDNNIISFKSSSETVSDAPYQMGVFNPHIVGEDSYPNRIQNIRNVLNGVATISDEDKAKIDNSLSLMKLIVQSSAQRTDSIKNIVSWACKTNSSLEDINLFNSISGSYFINDISNVGTKERLMSSLYDLLYYQISVDSWYVPKFQPFTPFLLYTGGDKTKSTFDKIVSNPNYDVSSDSYLLSHLHNRISPQSGMYYINEMSYKIDDSGNFTQSWKGKKYDYGFVNTIYKQLFASREDSYLSPNIEVYNKKYNTFQSTNFIVQNNLYSNSVDKSLYNSVGNDTSLSADNLYLDMKLGTQFEFKDTSSFVSKTNSLYAQKFEFENNILTVTNVKKTLYNLLFNYNSMFGLTNKTNDYFKNITLNNKLWIKYSDDVDVSEVFLSRAKDRTQESLIYLFGNNWFHYEPLKKYNMEPEKILYSCKNFIWDNFYSNTNFPDDAEFNSGNVFNNGYSYVTNKDDNFIETEEDLLSKISKFNFGTGLFINIQRFSHPSIDERNLVPYQKLEIDGELITPSIITSCDKFKIKNNTYTNFGWKSVEKYLVLDSSAMINFFKNIMTEIELPPSNISLSSWNDYKYLVSTENSYLDKWGLNGDVSDVDLNNFMKKSFVRSAWNFIANYMYNYSKSKIVASVVGSASQIALQKQSVSSIESYNNYYGQFDIKDNEYSEYTDKFESNYWDVYFRSIYNEVVFAKIETTINSITGHSESYLNDLVRSMEHDLKNDFSAIILNGKFQEFLNKWLSDKAAPFATQQIQSNDWLNAGRLLPFDFIFHDLDRGNKLDTVRFSGIRWNYDDKGSGLFGGELFSNLSIREVLNYNIRKENYLEEKSNAKKRRQSDRFWKFFKTRAELQSHKSEFKDEVIYNFNNQKYSLEKSKEYFQSKYGRIRIFIDDRWTYEKMVKNSENSTN